MELGNIQTNNQTNNQTRNQTKDLSKEQIERADQTRGHGSQQQQGPVAPAAASAAA